MARSEAELAGCTFKPNTGKSGSSYHRAQAEAGAAPAPRGFYECRTRLRQAGDTRRATWEHDEDRFGRSQKGDKGGGSPPVLLGAAAMADIADDCGITGAPLPCELPRRSSSSQQVRRADSRGASSIGVSGRRVSSRGGPPLSARGLGQNRARSQDAAPRRAVSADRREAAVPTSANGRQALDGAAHLDSRGACTAPLSLRSLDEAKDATSVADGSVANIRGADEERPALLFVDVNIAPGQPLERITLREGETVAEVAAEFAAKHVLTPALARRLHAMLSEVLEKQIEQQRQQQTNTNFTR